MEGPGLIPPGANAFPGLVAGRYYGNDTQQGTSYSTSALSAATIYAMWFPLPQEGASIDRIGAEITTISAGKSFRTAAYAPDGSRRQPGSLLVDSGALSAGATGFIEATGLTAFLTGGGVWLCINAEDATMAFRTIATATRPSYVGKAAGGGSAPAGCLTVAQAFGAFPAAFPAGAVPTTNSPIVNVRAA